MNYIHLNLLGRQTDQGVGQSLYGAIHITLHDHVQLLEVTHGDTTSDIIQGKHLLRTKT